MSRIIQKGNVRSDNYYDIRITEENGDKYYYHFLNLSDGETVIASKPFNLKNMTEISWNDLPIKLRSEHYKNVYPGFNPSTYQKNCFLFGKEKADEIEDTIRKKEEEKKELDEKISHIERELMIFDESEVMQIYCTVGEIEKVQTTHEKYPWHEYLVNDKWVIKRRMYSLVSIEEKSDSEKQKKEWGRRVKLIANLANTSFDMATVVGNIKDTEQAVSILKKIVELVNSAEFYDKFEWHISFYKEVDIREVKRFLSRFLSQELIEVLNWSKKFQNAVGMILKNK